MISYHTGRRGFTLVELLAVVAIIAIVTVIALPAIRSVQATAMQVGARQMANTLQLARQYAINNRRPVRVLIAVDASSVGARSNLVCRAYMTCITSNDANNNVAGWVPLHDWQFLPEGIVFSDLNTTSYNPIQMDPRPPLGTPTTRILGTAPSTLTAWQYFNNVQSMFLITNLITRTGATLSFGTVEFKATGLAAGISGSAAGLRLVQGSVADPSTRTLIVVDTNNWVYIECDSYGGRVRTRYRDSYR